jgi:hypothetical protein
MTALLTVDVSQNPVNGVNRSRRIIFHHQAAEIGGKSAMIGHSHSSVPALAKIALG